LPDTYYGISRNIEVNYTATPDNSIHANSARPDDYCPARDPGTTFYHNIPILSFSIQLSPLTRLSEVMRSSQQQDIIAKENVIADIHRSAYRIYYDI
jgi:hypothetical protein